LIQNSKAADLVANKNPEEGMKLISAAKAVSPEKLQVVSAEKAASPEKLSAVSAAVKAASPEKQSFAEAELAKASTPKSPSKSPAMAAYLKTYHYIHSLKNESHIQLVSVPRSVVLHC